MSGRSQSLAVAVGGGVLRCSSVWRIWTNFKRSTVFVALVLPKQLSGVRFKATFSSDGPWRLAESAQVLRWDRPGEFTPGWTFAMEIVVPNSEVGPPFRALDTPKTAATWCLPFDGDGDVATAFQVFLSGRRVPFSSRDWPGNDGSGDAELLARGPWSNGETMWLVRAKGEIVGDLRPQLEEARHNEMGRVLGAVGQHEGDAAVGWTMIKRGGGDGQLRVYELALRAYRSAQLVRDELDRWGALVAPATLALRLTALLEDIFGHDWLKRGSKKHPAIQHWRACRTLTDQQGGVRLPIQSGLIHDAAVVLQDVAVLARISGGELAAMKLGDIRSFGDAAVLRKMGSRLHDGPQWEELMVELYMAAWYLQQQGIAVTPLERDGFPDLRLDVDGSDVPTLMECKRLRTLSANRIGQVVKKANKQITAAAAAHGGPYSGVVVLDATDPVGFREGSSEATPAEITEIETAVAAALSHDKNRSIRQALIVWSYYRYVVTKEPSDLAAAMWVMRAGRYVDHTGRALRAGDAPIPQFSGTTVLLGFSKESAPPLRPRENRVGPGATR